MEGQMKKGVLEMCILCMISRDCPYGYEITKRIRSFFPDVNESTIYGVLRRLRSDESVEVFYGEDSNGPVRKYYKITPNGESALASSMDSWLKITKAVEAICFPEESKNIHG